MGEIDARYEEEYNAAHIIDLTSNDPQVQKIDFAKEADNASFSTVVLYCRSSVTNFLGSAGARGDMLKKKASELLRPQEGSYITHAI
jgi:hypothetical protein